MDDLVAWYLAQLDDIERAAHAAAEAWGGEHWKPDYTTEGWGVLGAGGDETIATTGIEELAEHIALHDPAAVLADIASKRALLAGCVETLAGEGAWDPVLNGGNGGEFELARYVIRRLAAALDYRPGYRQEWRP